jgi:hypothetical protein
MYRLMLKKRAIGKIKRDQQGEGTRAVFY